MQIKVHVRSSSDAKTGLMESKGTEVCLEASPDLTLRQKGPAVLYRQRAAVGNFQLLCALCVIENAAKVDLSIRKVKVWEVHFSLQGDVICMRVFSVSDGQNFFQDSALEIIDESRVKPDGQLHFLTSVKVQGILENKWGQYIMGDTCSK